MSPGASGKAGGKVGRSAFRFLRESLDLPNMPEYVPIKEAAKMLGISDKRVYAYIEEGRLPAVRAAYVIMISVEEVKKFKPKTSGRPRKNTPITTTLLDSDTAHIQQALGVLTSELGENYVPREVFETYIYDNNHFSGKAAFIAQDDMTGDVLGTLIAEIVSPQAFKASFLDSFDLVKDLPDVQQLSDKRIGLIKSVAVVPQSQGQGIGTQLVKDAMKKLEEHGAEVFYSLGWVSKERGCHIQGVLETLDFKMVSQLDSFWYKDSIKQGYSCPSCGHPCQCSTRLFVKRTQGLP